MKRGITIFKQRIRKTHIEQEFTIKKQRTFITLKMIIIEELHHFIDLNLNKLQNNKFLINQNKLNSYQKYFLFLD